MSDTRLDTLLTRLIKRPEEPNEVNLDGPPLPSYHELLDLLCTEFQVPGSPNFREAIQYIRTHYQRIPPVRISPRVWPG